MPKDPTVATEHGRRDLHTGPVGTFAVHDIELANGARFDLELLHHPGASAVVPFLDDEQVILIRQYRFAARRAIWEVPAGKRDAGEPPEACAARELAEETGYRAGRLVRTGEILTTPGFTDECIHLFCAYDLEPGPTAREPNELIELCPTPLAESIRMIDDGRITDGKTIAALYHAWRRAGSTP